MVNLIIPAKGGGFTRERIARRSPRKEVLRCATTKPVIDRNLWQKGGKVLEMRRRNAEKGGKQERGKMRGKGVRRGGSHEERRCSILGLTQSRISPSIL